MAISAGASLFTPVVNNTSSTTIAGTTSVTVPAGGQLAICVAFFGSAATVTVTGGSLTWTNDVSFNNSSDRIVLARARAPSGLASGTTITATFSAARGGRELGGFYYDGAKVTSPLITTNTAAPANGTAWNCGAVSTTASGQLVVGYAMGDGSGTTGSTPGAGWDERLEYGDATTNERSTLVDQGASSVIDAGSYTPSGTWGASQTNVGVSAVYDLEPSAAVVPNLAMAPYRGAY